MHRMFDLGPKQLASMTGNSFGAAYGWAQTVKQSGLYRLSIDADVPGLYLAGHWTMPGGGIAGVMTSGRLCARRVLLDMTTAKEAP
jgi:prolycopene isomerase